MRQSAVCHHSIQILLEFTINDKVVLREVPSLHGDRFHHIQDSVTSDHDPVQHGALLHTPQALHQIAVEPGSFDRVGVALQEAVSNFLGFVPESTMDIYFWSRNQQQYLY